MLAALLLNLGGSPAPPPPPPAPSAAAPYGPAVSSRRKRWFVDDDSPIQRSAKRKAIEYLQRVEFGILPPEIKAEIVEKAIRLAPQKAAEYIVEKSSLKNTAIKPERVVNAVLRDLQSKIRQELENRRRILDLEDLDDLSTILFLDEVL